MRDFARHLLASCPAVIYACKAGGDYDCIYIDDNVEELFGYRPEDFFSAPDFWKSRIHPDDRERVLTGLEAVFKNGRHVQEYRFQARDGAYLWMRDDVRLVRDEATGTDELIGSWLDISHGKTVEENYRRFAGLTSDYVHYCTRQGTEPFRVRWVDGAVNPISGYSIQDILDMGCWLPLVHPDDLQAVTAYLFGLVPGDFKQIEFRILTKQREIRWVSENSRCEAGSVEGELILYGAVTDITERKRAEQILQASESFLREAARVARLGRWRWNLFTDEFDWSSMSLEILGLASLGRKVAYDDFIRIVHPEDRGGVEAALRDAREHGHDYAMEHRIVRPDGSPRHLQGKGEVYRDAAGKPTSMVGTVLDVTEQKRVELRLRESDRIKSEFIATASHELRTPLAVIQGYAELLLDDAELGAARQREFLTVIHDKALALEKIVDDLLDVSRVESGRIICLEFGQSNIVEEIRRVVAHFQMEASGHRFSIQLPGEELCLSVDQGKIVQVLENLLGNAVKFSPQGSEIVVRAEWLDNGFQIMVEDSGVGIAPEHREHIFDKFYRVDATDTAVPGLGIGLYLVKKIVEAHRGRIWVESALGRGTKFFFTLPLKSQ